MLASELVSMLEAPFDPSPERIRPLSVDEYYQLIDLGWFQGESLELLCGLLVIKNVGRIRPLSRDEYDQLVDLGWFQDERIELLRGMLVTMSPQGRPHAAIVELLNERLVLQLAPRYRVRSQLPFAVDGDSEPEPDLVVARAGSPHREHPREALLVIEVANTSLHIDRGVKRSTYAKSGVPEYWIVHARELTVEVCTQPAGGTYQHVEILRDGDILRPTLLPDVSIPVADLPR